MLDEATPFKFDYLVEFCTGVDSLTAYEFKKKIDVKFKEVTLSKASTCALTLTLPTTKLSKNMITAVKFEQGFGVI